MLFRTIPVPGVVLQKWLSFGVINPLTTQLRDTRGYCSLCAQRVNHSVLGYKGLK